MTRPLCSGATGGRFCAHWDTQSQCDRCVGELDPSWNGLCGYQTAEKENPFFPDAAWEAARAQGVTWVLRELAEEGSAFGYRGPDLARVSDHRADLFRAARILEKEGVVVSHVDADSLYLGEREE